MRPYHRLSFCRKHFNSTKLIYLFMIMKQTHHLCLVPKLGDQSDSAILKSYSNRGLRYSINQNSAFIRCHTDGKSVTERLLLPCPREKLFVVFVVVPILFLLHTHIRRKHNFQNISLLMSHTLLPSRYLESMQRQT